MKKTLAMTLMGAAVALMLTACNNGGDSKEGGEAKANTPTLDKVKSSGQVVCGVNTGLAGFSQADSSGNWSGLDVDYCKALAAAVLGDATKVKYVPLNAQQRFTALQSGEVDVLARNTTNTLTRDASLGLHFVGVNYYDGQGFMINKGAFKSAKDMKGATVCVQSGTTTEKNLTDFSRANNLDLQPVVFEKVEASTAAYFSGRCQAYTTDASGLASVRSKEAQDPKAHEILPELISKEPLGPMVRRGDDAWFAINKWVLNGLIEAEEYGITKANVADLAAKTEDPQVGRILGKGEDTGKLLGLDAQWMVRAITAVGNYGEIFDRNVGPATPLALERGLNAQWSKGGVMYASPVR